MKVKASVIIGIMNSWVGMDRAIGTHKPIIDLYNSHTPLARNYRVTYKDSYCDTTVSAAFIKANSDEMIGGTECGCEEHIKLFKKAGIWEEDGTVTPTPGAIILYNWDQKIQPNNGYADHIGVVERVDGNLITVIEGNINGRVGRRVIEVGNGYIRGYAFPKYEAECNPIYVKGWHYDFNRPGYWYQYADGKGNHYANCVREIDGKMYAFDREGWMKEGAFVCTTDDTGAIVSIDG